MKNFNKIISRILILFFVFAAFFQSSTPAQAATSTLKAVAGYSYPTSLTVGQAYVIKGSVTSNYNITSLTAGIYTPTGASTGYVKTVTPNAKSYDLAGVDAALYFNKLSAGTYVYKVTAKDASGANRKVIDRTFTVGSTASNLSVSGHNYPSSLNVGQAYSIKGTVKSSYTIKSLTAGLYNYSDGSSTGYVKTVTPNATSYNLTGVDAALYFNKLSAGTYYYKVFATDSSGTTKTLINAKFTVGTSEVNPPSGTYENAIFPMATMNLSQLAYESATHGSRNAIDCVGSTYAFAPFTGKIVAIDRDYNYNTIWFQSTNKVKYPDGTLDYMTVLFMHGSNFSDLKAKYNAGTVISQGTNFYKLGGRGPNGDYEYQTHLHMEIIKGKVAGGWSYRGNVYAYNGLYINRAKTTSIIDKGTMESGNYMTDGGATSWANKWKTI